MMWINNLRQMVAIAVLCCWSIVQAKGRSAQSPNSANLFESKQQQEQQQEQEPYHDTNIIHAEMDNSKFSEKNDTDGLNIWQDISMVYRLYQQCSGENLSVCLKVKLLTGLEKMLRSVKTLQLTEGIQFIKTSNSDDDEFQNGNHQKLLSEKDIEAFLPRAFEAKEKTLNNLIFKRLSTFLRDHTLQVKLPKWNTSPADNQNFEGRKKDKGNKGGGEAYIMIPLLLGGTMVPIAYGALAMLAGKALIVSKLALVLATIIGLKKLLSSGGKESHEVVVQSGGHSGWGRDLDMAYSAWKPHKAKIL